MIRKIPFAPEKDSSNVLLRIASTGAEAMTGGLVYIFFF